MLISFAVFISLCEVALGAVADSEWVGKTFPGSEFREGTIEDDIKYLLEHDKHGRIQMGVKSRHCDWGEDPNQLDGNLGPTSYTCYDNRNNFQPDPAVHPILLKEHIPKNYIPWHRCMNESITYPRIVPTFGHHRPLWPRYGEYTFVPKQRWLHSIEHGAVVLLYHPCANENEVSLLRKIVKGCLYQYVITALNELDSKRPLVLVAWGASLEMSKVDPDLVASFIRKHAYKGPEHLNDDGQYDVNLVEPASLKFKGEEHNVCPLLSYVT